MIEFLKKEIQRANENIEFLLKKLYGRKTEKTSVIDGQLVVEEIGLGLFNEAETTAVQTVSEPVPFEEPVKRTRRGYKRKEAFRGLPQQDQIYKLEETQRNCPACGDDLEILGKNSCVQKLNMFRRKSVL